MKNIKIYLNNQAKAVKGWCSEDKAMKLFEIITKNKLECCVEIGVFGGSSLFPQAIALKNNGAGFIYGIDPWSNKIALEEMKNDKNLDFWSKVPMEEIYNHFINLKKSMNLCKYVKVLRKKSIQAVKQFEDGQIDLLHIDGNHSEKNAFEDAKLFYPKVKVGGFIFFDDTTWMDGSISPTTQKGFNYLMQFCEKVCELGKDCVVMKKIK